MAVLTRGRAWSAVEVAKLRQLWEQGDTVVSIARQIGRSPTGVRVRAARAGLSMAHQGLCTLTDLAQKFGCDVAMLKFVLDLAGLRPVQSRWAYMRSKLKSGAGADHGPRVKWYDPQDAEDVFRAYLDRRAQLWTLSEAAREMGVSRRNLDRALRAARVHRPMRGTTAGLRPRTHRCVLYEPQDVRRAWATHGRASAEATDVLRLPGAWASIAGVSRQLFGLWHRRWCAAQVPPEVWDGRKTIGREQARAILRHARESSENRLRSARSATHRCFLEDQAARLRAWEARESALDATVREQYAEVPRGDSRHKSIRLRPDLPFTTTIMIRRLHARMLGEEIARTRPPRRGPAADQRNAEITSSGDAVDPAGI